MKRKKDTLLLYGWGDVFVTHGCPRQFGLALGEQKRFVPSM